MSDYEQTPEGKVLLKRPDGTKMEHILTEDLVPEYDLPLILSFEDGRAVKTRADWLERRAELLHLFETHVYGKTPVTEFQIKPVDEEPWTPIFEGTGLRKQSCIYISTDSGTLPIHVLMFIPNNPNQPAPLFLGLNFNGNHTITKDPEIIVSPAWLKENARKPQELQQTIESSRGTSAKRWPVREILEAGFGLATIFYGDIDPDFDDGFKNGLHPLFYENNQTSPAADEWGSIGAWSFGLSRALDYLETEPRINANQVAVIGHSRLGKTALWAGAQDERFALVISNESGCGGAALSKRGFGEHLHAINYTFPHWFCGNFKRYNQNESALPIDQHQLLALIAPRPLYVASAVGDHWSDPCGEYLGVKEASTAYEFLGKPGLPMTEFPALEETDFSGSAAYHIRPGDHDLTPWDWKQFIEFAKTHLG